MTEGVFEISYVGTGIPATKVPRILLAGIDMANLIRMPDRVLHRISDCLSVDDAGMETHKVADPLGTVFVYHQRGRVQIGVAQGIPALHIRSLEIADLERVADQLGLPTVYASIGRPRRPSLEYNNRKENLQCPIP